MSNPGRKVLSVQGHSRLFSHRGGYSPECLEVRAVTACAALYGSEIPACVIPVPCVPSGLVTSRTEPWGIFLLSSSSLMWRLNIISAVSAAHGRYPCTKTVNLPHGLAHTCTMTAGHQGQATNQSTNQSVASRLFDFQSGLHGSCMILAAIHLLQFWQMFGITDSFKRKNPSVPASRSPGGEAEYFHERKMLKRRGQMLSYCKPKRARLSGKSWGSCTALKIISWVMILDSKQCG